MSAQTSHPTCILRDENGERTDFVKKLGLDYSGEGWKRPGQLTMTVQMSKWFGRILGLPGMSATRPSPASGQSEPLSTALTDPDAFRKLTRFAADVNIRQTDAFDSWTRTRPKRSTGASHIPSFAVAYDLLLLKHLSEAVKDDRDGGQNKTYPDDSRLITPYRNLPDRGPLLDHALIAATCQESSVADLCAEAQRKLTEEWAARLSGKSCAEQAVLMIHTEWSRYANVAWFDAALATVPYEEGAYPGYRPLDHFVKSAFEALAYQSEKDSAWLSDMNKLALDPDLMDWEIKDASKPFTKADARKILLELTSQKPTNKPTKEREILMESASQRSKEKSLWRRIKGRFGGSPSDEGNTHA